MSLIKSALLCPDKRGGHRCFCHGTFVCMKQGSGWITPIEEIDHPSASWNRGDIYVSEKDVFPGVTLEPGDSVVFYLYVDGKGLGAENVVQVWHPEAQAMKAVPSVQDISLASAFLAVSTILQATAPVVPNFPTSPAMEFSQFCEDTISDEDESACSANLTPISLADILEKNEPKDFPSVGSALHATGNCKMCSFFPKGNCTNGSACEFCHFEHDSRPKQKNKGKRVRERQKAHLARFAAEQAEKEKAATPVASAVEPMKCEISPFLMTMAKKESVRERSPSTCGSTDEGSCGEASDSSTWGSPASIEREPMCAPPPGLTAPPPGLELPALPMFLPCGRS